MIPLLLAAALTVEPGDCAKPTKPAVVHKHAHKPVKHPRLFKTEPKVEEEPCEGILPPVTSILPPEPIYDFTPAPDIPLLALDVPVPDVPPVEGEQPCDCFDSHPGTLYPGLFIPSPALYVVAPGNLAVQVPAVPEPSTWALMLAGLLVVARRGRFYSAQFSGKEKT